MSKKKKTLSRALVIVDLDNLPEGQTSTRGNFHVGGSLDELGQRARAELEWIEQAERMTPVRAIFLGIVLAQIRAALPHGGWSPWLDAHFGARKSTAYKLIAVAKACVADARILLPEVLALPQLPLDFKPSDPKADAAKALKKIERFAGGRSLQELYREYSNGRRPTGVIERAGKEVLMPEAARAVAKENLSDWIETGRQLLIGENACQLLTAAEVCAIDRGIAEILKRWRKAYASVLAR